MVKSIIRYEHGTLRLKDDDRFNRRHLDALINLNEVNKGNYFDIIRNGVRFKQYVGVIQIEGLCIEILPKADGNNDHKTKANWQNVLTDMLKICGRIKIHTSADANLSRSSLNLLELYFDQFLTEVQLLLRNGLTKQYRKEASNVKALKGKLDFAQNIRYNLVHKERFFTTHQVYDLNHKIHQVLAQAINIVRQLSSSMWVNDKCRRVELAFPEVKKIEATKQLLDSIRINRKTAPYERALELARLIILNYSPDISQGNDKMISILFNMNQLWEEYVLVMLKKCIRSHSTYDTWTIKGQDRLSFWNTNSLKPDIVMSNGLKGEDKRVYVIDTKWKTPTGSPSNHDLRQMYTYAHFWKSKKVMLLYPGYDRTISAEFMDENNITCLKTYISVLKARGELNDQIGMNVLECFTN